MIPRDAAPTLARLAQGFPLVAITGPRHAGKTTLAKAIFSEKPYVSLETADEREFALNDPKRFLARFPKGAILDEVQRCPELLSWLQGWVDGRKLMGDFVLTGSAQFDLIEGITQTLTGRVARVELLPLNAGEMAAVNKPPDSLGADCGVSAVTAKQWLSVLETSYIIRLLRPHHSNYGKRLVKAPKLYFLDSGLAAWLMGIRDADSLETHSARGALFETWVVSELYKQQLNRSLATDLYFWRDNTGNEIDLIFETPQGLQPIEIKSGSTYAQDWTRGLRKWQNLAKTQSLQPAIVYGGEVSFEREDLKIWGWQELGRVTQSR